MKNNKNTPKSQNACDKFFGITINYNVPIN